MTHRALRRFIAGLAGLMLCVCVGPATAVAAETPKAERPTYALGDKWVLTDGVALAGLPLTKVRGK